MYFSSFYRIFFVIQNFIKSSKVEPEFVWINEVVYCIYNSNTCSFRSLITGLFFNHQFLSICQVLVLHDILYHLVHAYQSFQALVVGLFPSCQNVLGLVLVTVLQVKISPLYYFHLHFPV